MGTRYLWFIAPAVIVTVAIIIFPWMFTIYMSLHDWQITGAQTFIGLENYVSAFADRRFIAA
ncbi:MAG: sugar ABC transporter permease, partial [Proteobacteria bacterium]|nr:sugar ABC transporter permease [Pseudomonadota bacterium]